MGSTEASGGGADARGVRRVLVSRVGRVGDMVLATPALRAVLDEHPGAEVHVVTSPEGARVLRGFDPRLAETVVYRRKGLGQMIRRWRVRRALERHDYDVVYCLDGKPTYHQLVAGLGRTQVAYEYGRFPGVPGAEALVRTVRPGVETPAGWVHLPVQDDARLRARRALAREGIGDDALIVGIHPSFSALRKALLRRGGYEERKLWPAAAWAELVRLVAEWGRGLERPLAVVSDLVPEDRPLGEQVARESGGHLALFVEPPDFERYKATLERMDVLVTPDTGPMHVAAAVGTRLVALFPERFDAACEPFTDPERYTIVRAAGGEGLSSITASAVLAAVGEQLRRAG